MQASLVAPRGHERVGDDLAPDQQYIHVRNYTKTGVYDLVQLEIQNLYTESLYHKLSD